MSPRPHLVAAGLVVAGMLPLGAAAVAAASPAPVAAAEPRFRVTDQRAIELPDSRIVSMSPDGRWLAVVRPALGYQRGRLCAVDVVTLEDRSCADLSGLGAGLRIEDVTWSPDGEHLAFGEVAFVNFRDGDLWLMDTATGALTNLDDDGFEGKIPLTDLPAGTSLTVPVSPAFSPDGTTIAFSRTTFDAAGRRNTISVVPVAGGPVTDLRTVAELPGIAYFGMAWTPDGRRIVHSFQSASRDDLANGIWVMDADGGEARLLVGRFQDTHGPAVLAMSPAGDSLLLWDPEALGRFQDGPPVYAVADLAHGTPMPLEPIGERAASGASVAWAGFSPDGSALMELHRGTDGDLQLWARLDPLSDVPIGEPLITEGLEMAGPVDRGIAPTWASNGTLLLTGGAAFDTATLLTIEDRAGG